MRSPCFSPARQSSSTSCTTSPSRTGISPRTCLFSDAVMERTLQLAEAMIVKWSADASTFAKVTSLFYENRLEAKNFIKCVNNLQKAMHLLAEGNSSSDKLVRCQTLMQMAMKRLQKEFSQILSLSRALLNPESVSAPSSRTSTRSSTSNYDDEDGIKDEIRVAGDSITEVECFSDILAADLKLISECMISSGYGKECMKIYKTVRKSIFNEGICILGIEKLSSSKIQKMDWKVLDLKIENWLEAMKVAVKAMFMEERLLCDHVFAASESMKESCFIDISKEGAAILFGFPETVLKRKKKSPEMVFRLLDLYTAIADHWQEIESIFSSESTSIIRSQAVSALARLRESVRAALAEFEAALLKDNSKFPVAGAGVHPLTVDSMSYLCTIADYNNILGEIIGDTLLPFKSSPPESYFDTSLDPEDSSAPAISRVFAWLILVLLCKLDSKAKHIKDVSLAYLFLANNFQHVGFRVRTSNLKYLLGEEWQSKQEFKIQQFAASYQRLAWDPIASILPEDPTVAMSLEEVKECFKRFNSSLEQAHRKQWACIVSDNKLRAEIKASVRRKLVPAYRAFYTRHGHTLLRETLSSYLRFTPEDVGNYISNLFFGADEPGTFSSLRAV